MIFKYFARRPKRIFFNKYILLILKYFTELHEHTERKIGIKLYLYIYKYFIYKYTDREFNYCFNVKKLSSTKLCSLFNVKIYSLTIHSLR